MSQIDPRFQELIDNAPPGFFDQDHPLVDHSPAEALRHARDEGCRMCRDQLIEALE